MDFQLPAFFETFNQKYASRAGNIFLLYGNVADIFQSREDGWKPLLPLICEELSRENRIFIHIDLSEGLTVLPVWPSTIKELPEKDRPTADEDTAAKLASEHRERHQIRQIDFIRKICGKRVFERQRDGKMIEENLYDSMKQESILSGFASLTLAKAIFEALEKSSERGKYRLIFIVSDAGAVVPHQNDSGMSEGDRRNVQLLQKWFNTAEFLASRHVAIMTSNTAEEVSSKIRMLPQVTHIKIKRPNPKEREKFISGFLKEFSREIILDPEVTIDGATEATAGLMIRDIQELLMTVKFGAKRNGTDGEVIEPAALSLSSVSLRAREVMEQSSGDHLEFIDPAWDLDEIAGQERLKPLLRQLASLYRRGNKEAIPSGILVSGPNGGGKSFIMQAFAKETGWHIIRLKNIRNMWYGETERIWEITKDIIEALGRVILIVDEGDTELGGRGRDVHEVDKRLFGRILHAMEDKKNKGKVSWIIITARPDKIEPDIKRSGRAGRHLPVFAPETENERRDFVEKVVLQKFGLSLSLFTNGQRSELLESTRKYYPADFDALIERLEEIRAVKKCEKIEPADVLEETKWFRPPDSALQRKLQILVAIQECTDDRLIPEEYTDLAKDREKLVQEIILTKKLIGEV